MRRFKKVFKVLLIFIFSLGVVGFFVFQLPPFGGNIQGSRLQRVEKSPEFLNGRFENKPPQNTSLAPVQTIKLYMQGQVREPQFKIPVIPLEAQSLLNLPSQSLSAIWFGHASVLVEIGGVRIMTDPILSDYASPFSSVGPKRFHAPPISLNDLSNIDAVVISHDHYDHLDMQTIQHLATKGTHFYIPLGIGAHLERWSVPSAQIHEMEWWDVADIKGVKIHCTPARHYSGRKRMNNSTLWSSWLVKSQKNSFYFSGDTGYSPHFSEIKNKLGAPDLALLKVGAYGDTWLDIHMDPESAVQAQVDLGAKILLPVHWATFNLAYHAWEEPIIRTLAAAKSKNTKVITPRIGERFDLGKEFVSVDWYK